MTPGRRLGRAALWVALLALALRLPFTAERLWDHDSVQFALAVESYDLAAHHPHPPGYPLYVAILKALAAVGIEPRAGMVALSVLAGAVGAGLMVLLAARLLGGGEGGGAGPEPLRAGVFAGVLYATNPLLWFYGELPLVYAVEGGLAVALAWAALRMADGRRFFVAACVLFALAAGVRQSTAVLLAPLALFGAVRAFRRGSLGVRDLLTGLAAGAAALLAWLVPFLAEVGGVAAYRRISAEHFSALLPHTSVLYGAGLGALAHNLEVLAKWTLQGAFPGAVALLALAAVSLRRIRRVPAALRALGGGMPFVPAFLLAWVAPPVLFFALFHVTKAGYTLVYLPGLLAGLAVLAGPLLAFRGRTAAALLVAGGLGAGLFLFGADRRPDQHRLWAVVRNEFNRGTIRLFEWNLTRLVERVGRLPPGETVLATVELAGTGASGADGFLYPWHRHLQWYLPEYPVVFLVPEQGFALVARGHQPFERVEGTVPLPAGTRRIAFVLSELPGERLPLGPGRVERIGAEFVLLEVPLVGERAEVGIEVGPLRLAPPKPGALQEFQDGRPQLHRRSP